MQKRATSSTAAVPGAAEHLETGPSAPQPSLDGIVHVLTCGSVDDGKSTLIGHLLWESSELPDDQREMVRRAAKAAGTPDHLDYALLLDGLIAEREQGITIDIAWRYVDAGQHRLVIIDSPGHEQYTRNMASGASHADVALMLVDARHGLKRQTRRHAAILSLMGVPRLVLAVNKMDLVGWNEQTHAAIARDFAELVANLGFADWAAIPVSARNGDNIAQTSANMPWYDGPSLVAHLETIPSRLAATALPFRMPIQSVLRDQQDFRGLAGTVTAGVARIGDVVRDSRTGRQARIARIATMDGDLREAPAGKAVALVLDSDLDIARGSVLCDPSLVPTDALTIEASLVWLADQPLDSNRGLLLRTATDVVPISTIEITSRLDLDNFGFRPAASCEANDVVAATILLSRPIAIDPFRTQRETGAFVLVDPITGNTLAAGVVDKARSQQQTDPNRPIVITQAMLAAGVCAGLASHDPEFPRRAEAVRRLLEQAGVNAKLDLEAD